MKLSDLLHIFPERSQEADSVLAESEVAGISCDSRQLSPKSVFVAIRGTKSDGHLYLSEAAAAGVSALIVEDDASVPGDFRGAVITVPDTRKALARLAARYHGEPSSKMWVVGVTGTNGKTTTTHMIEAILTRGGLPTGVIGTIDHHLGERTWPTEMTTPDPVAFHHRLKEFNELGARAVALEVSSHSLAQSRVDEVAFDVAIFTNLSRDHLDYHVDMADYYDAKARLFRSLVPRSKKPNRFTIVNFDDDYGRTLFAGDSITLWRYGQHRDADLRFDVIEQGFGGTRFRLKTPMGTLDFAIRMPGLHNVYNAVAAIGAGLAAGVSLETCAAALSEFSGVKGRLETVVNNNKLHVFVDYAHTDGALEAILLHLRGIRESAGLDNKIITVFGCGGDRDKGKRPLMAQAALAGSDFVVLTSDNPRNEDPQAIIDEALTGVDRGLVGVRLHVEIDRRKGIAKALKLASPGDVVLIAGKGHEEYQQIGAAKQPFSDVAVVSELMSQMMKEKEQ